MNQKNRLSNLISNFFLGLAIIGLLILFLMYGGKIVYQHHSHSTDISVLYPLFVGVFLILPYLITLKLKPRQKLTGNIIKNKKTREKNEFEIFVFNDSGETLIINRNSELEHNQWYVFNMKQNESLIFSNGIIFYLDENNNLEIEDFRNQIIGLEEEYFNKYDVPDYVNRAFIISKHNKRDTAK
jgi:hypothetical protein